jgi:hypothetical protein
VTGGSRKNLKYKKGNCTKLYFKNAISKKSMVKISSSFKRFTLSMLLLVSVSFVAKSQTLGTYSNTSVVSGRNTVISPSTAPTGTTSAGTYTKSNFTGVFTVNPTTGAVTLTGAKQAGIFTFTVQAFGTGTATTTFTLTVTNPTCSQGLFTGTTNFSVGTSPWSICLSMPSCPCFTPFIKLTS